MKPSIVDMFLDEKAVCRIKKKLPELFQIAELESQRAGKIGMEVGSIRERILVSLLIFYFGESNVDTEIPITESEVDVRLFEEPISIKTKTGSSFSGVKLIWTVDSQNAIEFFNKYEPTCDMLYAQIIWGKVGFLYYFPLNIQKSILNTIGRERYIKLPSKGTNPRGVEIKAEALKLLTEDEMTYKIEIEWIKKKTEFNSFKRWVELWEKD